MNNLQAYQNVFTPNEEVLAQFINILPEEQVNELKAQQPKKWELGLYIVKMAKQISGMEIEQAFDLVFGQGKYQKYLQLAI